MAYELELEVKKGLYGFSEEERIRVIVHPKGEQSPCLAFFLDDDFIDFPVPPARGSDVGKVHLPFIRDAIDFLLSSGLVQEQQLISTS